ncbi:MAG: hypothetical protein ACRDLN_00880 [Solirubrobacteraceae bacterium]
MPSWQVSVTLSNMETTSKSPSADEVSAALNDAEASRARLVDHIALPSWFFTSMAVAVTTQISTAALAVGGSEAWRLWTLAAGLAVFTMVAGVQLARFRRLNGVRLGGLASRVVLGTGAVAWSSEALALGVAIWASLDGLWWLMAVSSIAGGAAYALNGRLWLRAYRADPAAHARGASQRGLQRSPSRRSQA